MSALFNDVKFALRSLLKHNIGLTVVAAIMLGLGIGANATVFSWISSVLLSPLPGVANADEFVVVTQPLRDSIVGSVSYPDYVEVRDNTKALSGIIAFDQQAMSLGVGERPDRVWGMIVTGNYFDVLGVRMLKGRGFLPEEDRTPDSHPVVVLGEKLWRERFGGDPAIVDKTVMVNNQPFKVVGVAPKEFIGTNVGLTFDVYVPMMMQHAIVSGGDRLNARGDHWLEAMGRLAPGVTVDQATADLAAIGSRLAEQYPDTNTGRSFAAFVLRENPTGATTILAPVLYILLGVVGFVLLIACANVASLLLARASGRRREIAIRFSLGASRWQIARQLLVESLLLSGIGGCLGLLVAVWASGLLLSFAPPTDMPVGLPLGINMSVLVFTVAVTIATGILFGMAPVFNATRTDLVTDLKSEAGGHTAGKRHTRARSTLAVAQIAISLMLLVCAGLLLQSLYRAQSVDPGFNPKGVALASVDFFTSGYDPARGRTAMTAILDRVAALPTVQSATLARRLPLGFGGGSSTSFGIEGIEFGPGEYPIAYYHPVGPEYFKTMQIDVLAGRDIARSDTETSQPVVFVNETFARRFWQEPDAALGKQIRLFGKKAVIAGVVHDTAVRQLNEKPALSVYLPLQQFYFSEVTVVARTDAGALPLSAALAADVRAYDPGLLVFGTQTLETQIAPATFQQRLSSSLIGIFGVIALVMAAVGLYGVIAFSVGQRTREIGIRMALGAGQSDVLLMILKQGFKLTGIGVLIGCLLSAAVTRLMTRLLFGVSPTDPATYVIVAVFLGFCALAACYLPARRATIVDPVLALRAD